MRDAYRDDLAAAELRVRDLEREHTALVARNTALEAAATTNEATKPAAAPAPVAKRRVQFTPGEQVVMLAVIGGMVAISIAAHLPRDAAKGLMALVVLGMHGLIHLRRQLIEPTVPVEHRLETPPAVALTEEEANQARLAEAVRREQEEAAARANAARVEAEVRAIAKAHPPDKADTPRSVAMMLAFVGCITAGALGSLTGIGIVIVAAGGALWVIDRRKAK